MVILGGWVFLMSEVPLYDLLGVKHDPLATFLDSDALVKGNGSKPWYKFCNRLLDKTLKYPESTYIITNLVLPRSLVQNLYQGLKPF